MESYLLHGPAPVNAIGHLAGAMLFAALLVFLWRDRRAGRARLAAASLAMAWNAGSLVFMAVPEDAGVAAHLLAACSSTALTFLAAVLLHLSLEGRYRIIVTAAYGLAVAASGLHWSELAAEAPLERHREALVATAAGFAALTILAAILLAVRARGERHISRLLGTMSLLLFTLSFVHFGETGPPHFWLLELVQHHAGIPLALFVLLKDYRFALLDVYLRVVANVTLAAVLALALAKLAGPALEAAGESPGRGQLLWAGACLMLIAHVWLAGKLQRAMTRVLFKSPDLDAALRELRSAGPARNEGEYLEWAGQRMAHHLGAVHVEALAREEEALRALELAGPVTAADLGGVRAGLEERGVEAVVPLRLSGSAARFVLLGRRPGGRRYLSSDLQWLERMAAQAVERAEQDREVELRRLAAEAELRALESQIQPHFLFNTLNTLYGIIPKEAQGARSTVLNLADILRHRLRTGRTLIPLNEELRIVRAYLDVESLRLGRRLRTAVEADEPALGALIPVLSVQPLVENAVRHGVAPRPGGGEIRLEARVTDGRLEVRVAETGDQARQEESDTSGEGVGLENVKRRLELCFGETATLTVDVTPGGSTAAFSVPLRNAEIGGMTR